MKSTKLITSVALLWGLTACSPEGSIIDVSRFGGNGTSFLSGTYERVAIRRASDVAGGPLDPSLDELLVANANFGKVLEWIDGSTCSDWSIEPTDNLPVSIDDPNLSDTQVPPNDPPITVGDKRQNLGYQLFCEGKFLASLLKVDERVFITPSPSGLSNVVLERPLNSEQILAFQTELKSMKFYDGEPSTVWTQQSLSGVSSYAEYRGAAYHFNRSAITENLVDGLGVLIPIGDITSGEPMK